MHLANAVIQATHSALQGIRFCVFSGIEPITYCAANATQIAIQIELMSHPIRF